jgi:hypothetical protein
MIKIFITQPMMGKTQEEINLDLSKIMTILYDKELVKENEFEIIDAVYPEDLQSLAHTISRMALADIIIFAEDYKTEHGCRIIYEIAKTYNSDKIIKIF